MSKSIVFALMLCVSLTGCATLGFGGSSGYGNNYRGGSENATLLGAGGAILGAAVFKSNPAVGLVAGGLTGYYVGQEMDRQQSAQGYASTECRSTLHRTYNRDGSISSVSTNNETCQSRAYAPGYRTGYNR